MIELILTLGTTFLVTGMTVSPVATQEVNLDRLCNEFSLNSRCQVVKLNLDRSGEDDEWIRIEKSGNTVNLLHTTTVKDNLASTILNGALGFIPVPFIPFDVNKYSWEDHQVTEVSFKSDRCKTNSCIVTGKKTLKLPKDTNIYQGVFTIQYQEKDLVRSLSFRIPEDLEATTTDTVIIEVPDET